MRKAITALLLAASAASPVFAQPAGPGEINRDRREVRQDRREVSRDLNQGRPGEAVRDARELGRDRREFRQDGRGNQDARADRRDDRRDDRDDRRDGRGFDNRYAGSNNRGGNWNNGWRNDRRYDWQGYRQYNRRAYALPRYYAPSGFGYGYRRFGVGLRIGAPFYSQRYLISDPWAYRLPPAYGPYRWVRYYDDVLLIDTYTGVVRDAIYGFFN